MGDQQVFVIPDQVIAHVLEFPAFLILGALCGVVAFLFTRATIRLARFADNMPVPRFALPAMAGIAVAVQVFGCLRRWVWVMKHQRSPGGELCTGFFDWLVGRKICAECP